VIAALTMPQLRGYLERDGGGGEPEGVPMTHEQLCAYVAAVRARKAEAEAKKD